MRVIVKNVTKSFRLRGKKKRLVALNGVTFSVSEGEVVGIIGSNGSGKTTLLRILGGILLPDSGDVTVPKRKLTLLELGAGFHPSLTGKENVYLNGTLLGLTPKQLKAAMEDIFRFAQLEDFADVPVRTYSKGMVSKLGLAVGFFAEPDLFLLDESLSVGDERFQRKVFSKIREFSSAGKTFLIVSHDLRVLREVCGRVIWLEKGGIVEDGNTESILEKYVRFAETNNGNNR